MDVLFCFALVLLRRAALDLPILKIYTSETNRRAKYYWLTLARHKALSEEPANWERPSAAISAIVRTVQEGNINRYSALAHARASASVFHTTPGRTSNGQ